MSLTRKYTAKEIVEILNQYTNFVPEKNLKIVRFVIFSAYKDDLSKYFNKFNGPGVFISGNYLEYSENKVPVEVKDYCDIPIEYLDEWSGEVPVSAEIYQL